MLRKPRDATAVAARLRLLTDRYAEKDLFDGAVRRALRGLAGPGAGSGCGCGCGCAHDAQEGMTYGFYPLWADGAAGGRDFDVLSRIGLYGMTIDDKGSLQYPPECRPRPGLCCRRRTGT